MVSFPGLGFGGGEQLPVAPGAGKGRGTAGAARGEIKHSGGGKGGKKDVGAPVGLLQPHVTHFM